MNIDINGVKITLTKSQLEEINKQCNKKFTLNDLNSYSDACKILNCDEENLSNDDKLKIIIKAANFIDNQHKNWNPDFSNRLEKKYYPIFEYNNSVWLVNSYDYVDGYALLGFGYYYKNSSTALLIANKFLPLYVSYLTE